MTSTALPFSFGANSLAYSLNRDALLAYAYHLYDRPGTSFPGMTSIPLTNPILTLTNPTQIYKLRLLPLLITLRSLHPHDLSVLLLMSCTQYALGDFNASIQTSHDILGINPNFVRFP
jgi:protein O-GlcNAc transferase